MKSIHLKITLTVVALLVLVISCNKDIDSKEQLFPLTPASLDATAGSWKMIVMTSPTQVALPLPVAITSPAYLAELVTIKDLQSKLSASQKKSIEYWSGGGILRWNQILRELVARYNLPPPPNADGSYNTPDAENPFGDTEFPFSNPPYSARAYSYVSAAQYDAMKATWYFKYQPPYNRAAPYTVDTGVQALVPKTDLPAYPSEDAVMSGVTAEVLKALFPGALEEITLKAAEQRNAALWSGKASQSDISAGLAFGKSIAALFTARAGGDGMKGAIGTKPQWDALADTAIKHGQIPWLSQEIPARPPQLPFFGKVKTWNMTAADVVSTRPPAPPSTDSKEMADEVAEVKHYATNVTRERLAIVHKWADGVGTYTPQGHWNDIAEEYVRDANYSEVRAARFFAMLNMAMHDAGVVCWDTKYYYFNPRPTQMDRSIKTATGLPNFPAYISGHSTFSGAAATVLSYFFPDHAAEFNAMALEASNSRLYGAIHYRSDIEMGIVTGNKVGGFTVTAAQNDGGN
jgi:PAP2 superfamily